MSPRERRDRSDPQDGNKRDLTPHPLTAAREGDSGDQGLTVIVGFVGAGRSDDHIRVYVDLALTAFYEVEAADVVRTQQVDREDPDSPRRLWIKADAQVRVVRVDQVTGPASFVQGSMQKRYAGRLASDPTTLKKTDFPCTIFWICDPSSIAITEATGGTWPCSGTDVWPQCPDCC